MQRHLSRFVDAENISDLILEYITLVSSDFIDF